MICSHTPPQHSCDHALHAIIMVGFTMLENSGSLQITSLQKSDVGVYRCNASNIARSISSDDSVLQVLGKYALW